MRRQSLIFLMIFFLISPPVFSQTSDEPESWNDVFQRHRTLGLIAAPLVGLQIGLGVGLKAHPENPPNDTLRGLHLISAMSLVGIGIYQFFDGPKLAGKNKKMTKHGLWAYHYLGLLVATGLVGFVQGHLVDRDAGSFRTLSHVHTGLGAATGGALMLTILNIPFGLN